MKRCVCVCVCVSVYLYYHYDHCMHTYVYVYFNYMTSTLQVSSFSESRESSAVPQDTLTANHIGVVVTVNGKTTLLDHTGTTQDHTMTTKDHKGITLDHEETARRHSDDTVDMELKLTMNGSVKKQLEKHYCKMPPSEAKMVSRSVFEVLLID